MQTPSATLVKRLLINGAVELRDDVNRLVSRERQGFGRIDVNNSTSMIVRKNGSDFDESTTSEMNQWHQGRRVIWQSDGMTVPDGLRTLSVTLVYSDIPVATTQELSMNMNLTVWVVLGGYWEAWHGNMRRSDDCYDLVNNVEKVVRGDLPRNTTRFQL